MALDPLSKVLLSWPSLISLQEEVKGSPRRSWIQLAKTGSFVSTRYGKFSITKQDLSMMLANFNDVTPKAPTELPVDYDHLSMDPKKPGDGVAAGWMKKLELRENGDELWCEVEWTPDGAERIANQEYRFVSPSFVKNHTHKDGKKIGTTLLAAAITNHPFLEGMSALTLYNFSTIGDLALTDAISLAPPDASGHYDSWDACVEDNQDKDNPEGFCAFLKARKNASWDVPAGVVALSTEVGDALLLKKTAPVVVHLSEVGQRVMIAPGNARTQDEIGGTFEITEVVGDGENAFVTIKDANGVPHKWFRATELLPASATPANPIQPNLEPAPGTPAPGAPGAHVPGGEAAAAAAATAAVPPAVPPTEAVAHEAVAQQVAAVAGAPKEPAPNAAAPAAKPAAAPAAAAPAKPAPAAEAKPGEANAGGAAPEKKVASGTENAQNVGADGAKPDVEALIKKKVAAALAGAKPQKGTVNMMFKLRNDKNEEIEVTAEQLAAAGIKVVPEGSTVIATTELETLKGAVTSLSSRMETLATETATAKKSALTIELSSELNRLSKAGLVTKATRDALEAQFKDATDLTAFKAITASFTTPVVQLNTEHGSGGDAPVEKNVGEEAQGKIIALANTIAKERGLSLRDATIAAGAELSKESEAYRELYSGASA